MTADLFRVTACSLGLMFLPATRTMPEAWAHSDSVATSPQLAQLTETGPLYSPQQLDQLLAPIALYPDPLLAQILMASTYPLEVVEAAQWSRDRHNAKLQGDRLDAALQPMTWDPSVKSLVPFPQVLQMMDSKLEWTQALGNAFLSQQADVGASIQRLRAEAQAAKTLRSSSQETVSTEGQIILIEPASPEMVYVPYYDSRRVYGTWNHPENPPTYFPPPPNYGYVEGDGIFFGAGLVVVGALWGWERWDWSRHDIHIDPDRYNRINDYTITHNQHPRATETTWRHDPSHRRGVPYGDAGVRQRYQPGAGSPDNRRDYRGYEKRGGAAMPLNQAPAAVLRSAPMVDEHKTPSQTQPSPQAQSQPQSQPQHAPPQVVAPAVHAPPARQPAAHATAPAFSSFGRGPEVRSESQRGQSSRQSQPSVMHEPRAPAPQVLQHNATPAQQHSPPPPADAAHPKRP